MSTITPSTDFRIKKISINVLSTSHIFRTYRFPTSFPFSVPFLVGHSWKRVRTLSQPLGKGKSPPAVAALVARLSHSACSLLFISATVTFSLPSLTRSPLCPSLLVPLQPLAPSAEQSALPAGGSLTVAE